MPSMSRMTDLERFVPPPSFIQLDEDVNAKPASKRLKRSPFRRIYQTNIKRTDNPGERNGTPSTSGSDAIADISSQTGDMTLTDGTTQLEPHIYAQEEFRDQYQWAVLYENQRGLTIFSTAYYSRLSLLPNDPLPFTMPNADKHRSNQPKVSPSNYPLPDGSWRWASKSWMVDMRGTTGQVQHDGFEYNLLFRKHKWHAASKLSSGAFVRRRRWLRLMVKPARQDSRKESDDPGAQVDDDAVPISPIIHGPPSIIDGNISDDPLGVHPHDVLTGSNVDEDWNRCHALLQLAGRDGKKLELWHRWLGLEHAGLSNTIGISRMQHLQKQWSEDSQPMLSEVTAYEAGVSHVPIANPPVKHIGAVLQKYADHILSSFIYPESRAHFIELIAQAGLLPNVLPVLSTEGVNWLVRTLDFNSYLKDFDAWL